jgi:serine/threonine-protein kinase
LALTVGAKLGPYEILSAVGAGGQGEVYKARDTRLNRTVAIKVLSAHFSEKAEMKARFEREAQTIAGLNHPHICVLYDVGHQDGTDYLVMEYLDGQTLAARLAKGALPLDDALKIAVDIADALDKAHRQGVVHRDLKPSNVMLTKAGAKLLDFGLAKLKQDTQPVTTLSAMPTNADVTAKGAILGTLQYMSPEQLEGLEADARSDIFAFGVTVYEMVTGKKAFTGQSQASLISAIMSSDPLPMASLQPVTPTLLDRTVKKCVAKEPEDRWQSAKDLHDELKWIAEAGPEAGMPAPLAKPAAKTWRRRLAFGIAGLLAWAVTGIAIWNLRAPAPQPVSRMVITLPAGDRLPPADQRALALSPDGKLLAYVAIHDAVQQLYLRPINGYEAKGVAGTEGATAPFFSPDSQWIGFHADGKLKKVSVGGGAVVTLSDASALTFGHGASWGDNDVIAFQTANQGGLSQVSAAGGAGQRLTALNKGELIHRWPDFLPGGKMLLLSAASNNVAYTDGRLAAYASGTGQRHDLNLSGLAPRYAATGHLVFAQAGTLMAAPFDAKRLEVKGPAVPVVEGVLESLNTGNAQYAISAGTGSLAYVSGGVQGAQNRLVWVSRNGMEQPVAAPARSYVFPRLSPDGKRVAAAVSEQETQIWTYDLGREALTRMTFEGNLNFNPQWTPDGKRIAFYSNRAGPINLFWQMADGSGGVERLTTSEFINSPASFSPDGRLLAYVEITPTTDYDIWVLRLSDASADSGQSRKAQLFLRTPFTETAPRFSPDGRWLAYASNESGKFEIYVQPYPGPGGKWQISTEGGMEPVWNPKGGELFYRNGNKMMVVDVETKSGFSVGKPRLLFDAGSYSPTPATYPNYDVSNDGRFLMLKPSEQQGQAATQINVVLNWFEELKQRVPVR